MIIVKTKNTFSIKLTKKEWFKIGQTAGWIKTAKNPCWKGYKQIGIKNNGKKKVPNCVPSKKAQFSGTVPVDQLVNSWNQLSSQLGVVNITGSNVNYSVNLKGKSISIRPLLDKVINLIKPKLTENGVKEIDTSPLPAGIQGLAVSSEPGKIRVDIEKICKQFFDHSQAPIIQNDGTEVDPDMEKQLTNAIAHELLATIAHESAHSRDYSNEFQKYVNDPQKMRFPRFDKVQEAPGGQFENQIRNQYKSQQF